MRILLNYGAIINVKSKMRSLFLKYDIEATSILLDAGLTPKKLEWDEITKEVLT